MTDPDQLDPEEQIRRLIGLHSLTLHAAGMGCGCGEWVKVVPYNAAMAYAEHARHRAKAMVQHLTRVGLLTEPGAIVPLAVPPVPDAPGEWWQEYGVEKPRHPGPGTWVDHGDGEDWWTEDMAREELADTAGGMLMRRRSWIGPWEPVTEEQP